MNRPTVSVVIPTVKRISVRAAIISALNQTYPPLEVIVAVDRPDGRIPQHLDDLRDKIRVVQSGGVGPGGARMQASLLASGDVVAFLDDDDAWFPEKLERQLAMWPTMQDKRHTMMGSRFVMIGPDGELRQELPGRPIASGERLQAYLFRRSQMRYWEGGIHPSTLMCDRDLLDEVPWDKTMRLHEDWDWYLRVGSRTDVEILMSTDVLVGVGSGDAQSLSRHADWKASFSWLEERAEQFTPRELGDFLLCYPAVLAVRSGTRRQSLRLGFYALAKGRPGFHSWVVWALNLLSPTLVGSGVNVLRVSRAGRKTPAAASSV